MIISFANEFILHIMQGWSIVVPDMNALRPVVVLSGKDMHQMVGRCKKIRVNAIAYLALHDMKYAHGIIIIPFLYFWPWSTNALRRSSTSKTKKKVKKKRKKENEPWWD